MTELERSVKQAPGEIEAEKQKGVQRFGKAFEQGDYIAICTLQQVTIEIQNSLLEKLRSVKDDDEVVDFTVLTDEADIGRNKIKSALYDLYQRLYQSSKATLGSAQSPFANTPLTSLNELPLLAQRVMEQSNRPQNALDNVSSPNGRAKSRVKGKFLSNFRRKSEPKRSNERRASAGVSCTANPGDQRLSNDSTSRRQSIAKPQLDYDTGEANPWQIWCEEAESESADSSQASQHSYQSTALRIPDSENTFLGFCEAAWKLQYGDRKASKKTYWAQTSRFSESYFFCTSCSYYCRMHETHLWDKIWQAPQQQGIWFRWSFLAKSHAPQSKRSTSSDYSYVCMFCAFEGLQAPPRTLEALFQHIGAAHRDEPLDKSVLDRTKCINDHICREAEIFDINIAPRTSSGQQSCRKDSLVSASSGNSN